MKNSAGFTIVEIIAVIAIIGILVLMTAFGIQGAQVQARNSQTAAAVVAYKKALEKYLNYNGKYPIQGEACLGNGYTDYDSDGSKDCWHLDPPSGPTHVNTTLDDALKPFLNNEHPTPSTTILPYTAYKQVGIKFSYAPYINLDGADHDWYLSYTMEGNGTKCPIGPVLSMPAWPDFTSTPPASGYTEAYGTVGTGCWIALPDPKKL